MKKVAKIILLTISLPLTLPLIVYSYLIDYKSCSILISMIPLYIGDIMRWWYYKITLKKVGENFKIGWGSYIVYQDIEIGNNVTIEEKCIISKCKIGDNVILASGVSTLSGKNHHYVDDLSKTFYENEGHLKTIVLENNLWIGTHAVLMEDVSSGTVVAAGSVVTKKFPQNAILGGIPARLIRMRGHNHGNQ